MEDTPDFWSDPKAAAPILRQKKALESALEKANSVQSLMDDLRVALELAQEGDSESHEEGVALAESLAKELSALEVQSLLGDELDINNAAITINAGAGGTESCDWASMLFRMYVRYVERQGWKSDIFDLLEGEEAGIKNVTFEVAGEYAYGLLKSEIGVHRLVRISPFDSNNRRHTSFASVFVSPIIDDDIEVEVTESDLRVDTYRASGAGGQHVNKTDSAVRITHLPSGIVVQCQNQRSQHQNREQAMKLLKSKLYEQELEKRRQKQDALEDAKTDISWGHQIRSYVLHPYKMIKDHRTNLESHSPDAVLDGELDAMIHQFLIRAQQKSSL